MIVLKLREIMEAHQTGTAERMTYQRLSTRTGIPIGTLQQMGSKPNYYPSLRNVEKICLTLGLSIQELIEIKPDSPNEKTAPKVKSAQKRWARNLSRARK